MIAQSEANRQPQTEETPSRLTQGNGQPHREYFGDWRSGSWPDHLDSSQRRRLSQGLANPRGEVETRIIESPDDQSDVTSMMYAVLAVCDALGRIENAINRRFVP